MTSRQLFDGVEFAAICHCSRCNVRLRLAPTSNPNARLLKHAAIPEGLCVNCCATEWLQTTANIRSLIENPKCLKCGQPRKNDFGPRKCECHPGEFPSVGDILQTQHIQAIFTQLLAVGYSDASPEEIDWLEVAANWELPFEKPKRRRKKTS